MSYLKAGGDGVYNIPALNASSQLYIRGKKFEDYINELVLEDQFEQSEVDEIKLLLQYLDTTGLNQAWLVDNSNRNAELKTAITALQTKLAQIDTTALTETSVLTNDNRNSVLKTRADGTDTNVGTLINKTRFITTSQLGTTANDNYSALYVDVNNGQYATGINEIRLGVGQFDFIKLLRNFNDETLSQILLFSGKINQQAQTINLQGNVNIGTFKTGLITPRDNNYYKIGGANSKIDIGATEDPEVTDPTTEIYIGKRTTLRNTKTFLRGNILVDEARITDVTVTDVVTWQNVASWLAGFTLTGVPYFIATFALGGTPSYRYSDVVKMANNYLTGGLTKNGKIETSNDLALKALTIVNTDLVSLSTPFDGLLNRLVLQAFAIHGSHSIGTIWGKVNMYAGRGEVELRNDGGIFDWAFKNAGNSNQLVLKDDNVELIQCNGGSGDTGRKLTLGACCGNIEMITGSNGVRSAATKVMEIKANKQVKIGNNSDAIVDDTYKVLIDAASHTNGLKLVKGTDALLLNPTNVSAKSITLQDSYTGTTNKTLYTTENGAKLFYGTTQIVPTGSGSGGSGGVDYDSTITTTTADATPPPSFYGQMNLVPNFFEARLYTDIFISANGKYAWAVGNNLDNTLNAIVCADNHGYNWNPNNTIDNFRTISGTAIGDVVWAIASGTQQNGTPYNVIYESKFAFNNVNFDWTVQPVITLDNFNTAALPQQIRVSSDGKYQIITDYRSNTNAKVYLSADYGKIWTTKNITPNFVTRCIGCAISGTGKYMYVCVDGLSTGQGGLYQSKDFGETWARVLTAPADPHKRVSCDATGRYVAIGRGSNMQVSRDYGFSWRVINESNNLSVCVSPDGQFCWFGQSNGNLWFMNSYLTQLQVGNDFSPNPRPSGNTYVNQAHDCIAVSNKGTVVIAAGLAGKLNLYRELPSEVRLLSTSTSILVKASADLAGAYSLEYKPPTSGNNNIQRSVVENQLAPVAGSANTPPEDRIVAATSIVPRKPLWYNTTENWKTVATISQTGQHRDCYMSDTGRYILTAMGTDGNALSQFQLNLNRGYTDEIGWQLVGPTEKYWRSVCGSSIGNRMYAVSAKTPLGDLQNSLWTSSDYGVTWTQLTNTPTAFKTNTTIGQVRCCGIGRNVFISSLTGGNIYRSEDFGATWTTITVNFGIGTIPSIHVNSVGQYVFATIPSYGIWRSYDFGLTFQQVNTSTTAWLNIACNATAQFVVATRSGATYAYSDDYGTSWTFGAATYVDVTIAPAGNLVWFCADGVLANSDNNGVTIRSTLSTAYNPQSLAMNATGEYVFAPLLPSVGNGTLAIKALNLREGFTNTRNIVAGTGIEIVNQGEGSYQISATASPTSSGYSFVSYTTWSSQDTFQTLPVMDFINYDYEMIMHVANQPAATWLYLFWNGQNSVSHYGELIYTPSTVDGGTYDNVTYTSGSGDGFPYWVYSGATAYTGNPTREVYTRYRFRGVNSIKFLMSPEGRPHLSWSDNSIAKQPPFMVYKQNTTYATTGNNANWAPQSIRVAGSGNQLIKMTWLRINKISSA